MSMKKSEKTILVILTALLGVGLSILMWAVVKSMIFTAIAAVLFLGLVIGQLVGIKVHKVYSGPASKN